MYSRTLFVVAVALLGGLTSCDDDSSNPILPTIVTARELVIDKTWKVTATTEKKGDQPAENLYLDVPSCFQDNLYTFQASGAFVLDEGPTRCDQQDPQTRTGTWALSNSGTTLRGTITLATQPGNDASLELGGVIESLTATRLMLVERDTTGGVTTVTRTTLMAQ